jgi:hypothetical protein
MVNRNRFDEAQRTNAAWVVQQRFQQTALRFGISVERCIWNKGVGMKSAGPHCLTVCFNGISENVFFSDYELSVYGSQKNIKQLDSRLIQLLEDMQETQDYLSIIGSEKNCWSTVSKTSGN